MYKIAIDGPSASGKTEVAKLLSKKLNILAVDTGAIYRALTLYCIKNNIDIYNEKEVILKTKDVQVNLEGMKVYLNGTCVTDEIRTSKVSLATSVVAKIEAIREKVTNIQRNIAATQSVIMQGRDITSVVLPEAEVKIYLNASLDERARRRQLELLKKGEEISFEKAKQDIEFRDKEDMTREISPLIKTEDSIEIDSTNLSAVEVVEKILDIIKEKNLEV